MIPICFLMTAVLSWVDTIPIELPRQYHAFQPVSIARTGGGFVLAANSEDEAAGGWSIALLKIDNDLRVVSERVLKGEGSNTVQKIIGLEDGLILLGNTTCSEGTLKRREGIQDIVVARLDEELEVRWSINIGGRGSNHAQDIVVSGETVTILGWIDTPGKNIPDYTGGWDIVVAKCSLDGELIWVKSLGSGQDDVAGVLLSDGDSVFVGYNTWSKRRKWDIEIVRLEIDGRIGWRKTVRGRGSDLIGKLIPSQEGLIVLGSTDSDNFAGSARGGVDIFVLRLSDRGTIKWAERIGGSRIDMAADIVETNGMLTILGWSESNDVDVQEHIGGKDIVVFKVDLNDREVQSYTFGTLDDDWPLRIISMQDRHYFFGSTQISATVQQPFYVKLH